MQAPDRGYRRAFPARHPARLPVVSAPMNSEEHEEIGPIDYIVVEFPGSKMTGEGLPILVDLVERGIIRLIDLVFFTKAEDGSVAMVEIADFDGELADLYNRLRRAIQRWCVEACNEYHWEIPFTQVTLHQPRTAD